MTKAVSALHGSGAEGHPEREASGPRRPRRAVRLRPARFDDLGLRRAISDRLLPLLVAAMAFLAALALAGAVAASTLARQWQEGAGSMLTVQVPQPGGRAAEGRGSREEQVLALLRKAPGVASVRALDDAELDALLRPWLGSAEGRIALPLPAVVEVRLGDPAADTAPLAAQIAAAAPGTLIDGHDAWMERLSALARSLQACAGLATAVVAGVAAAVIAAATRAGLAARRDAIEIVHGLGATDGYIAGRFARRATGLATLGAACGAAAALPLLLGLAHLAAPFSARTGAGEASALPNALQAALPAALWLALPALPVAAAAIGWLTAQVTVRRWLRRLP